jgi:hypothetical protein
LLRGSLPAAGAGLTLRSGLTLPTARLPLWRSLRGSLWLCGGLLSLWLPLPSSGRCGLLLPRSWPWLTLTRSAAPTAGRCAASGSGRLCGSLLCRLAGFVAVAVVNAFNLRITLLGGVFAFLKSNVNHERQVVQLLRILNLIYADGMADCGKLTVSNLYRLSVTVVQVQTIRATLTLRRSFGNRQNEFKKPAVFVLVLFQLRMSDNDGMPSNRQLRDRLRRVHIASVKQLIKCNHDSPL